MKQCCGSSSYVYLPLFDPVTTETVSIASPHGACIKNKYDTMSNQLVIGGLIGAVAMLRTESRRNHCSYRFLLLDGT